MNAPPGGPPENAVFLEEGQQLDAPLRRAVADALPEGTTFGFISDEDENTWMCVIGPEGSLRPEVTREVLNTALASLGRPTPGSRTRHRSLLPRSGCLRPPDHLAALSRCFPR